MAHPSSPQASAPHTSEGRVAIRAGRPACQATMAASELAIDDQPENLRPCTERNTRAPCTVERHAGTTSVSVRGAVDRHVSASEHVTDSKEDGAHTVRQYGVAPVCG